MTTTGFGKLGT